MINEEQARVLWDEIIEYDCWRRLGHRPMCWLLARDELAAGVVEARVTGRPLTSEEERAWAYLRRCPICRATVRETIEYMRGALNEVPAAGVEPA